MLSQRALYALNALVPMVAYHRVRQVTAAELARWAGTSPRNVETALVDLKQNGILRSIRGANGGYVFARDPEAITFADIVRALDGPIQLAPCAGEFKDVACQGCVNPATCLAHPHLAQARAALVASLASSTLTQAFERDGSPRVVPLGQI